MRNCCGACNVVLLTRRSIRPVQCGFRCMVRNTDVHPFLVGGGEKDEWPERNVRWRECESETKIIVYIFMLFVYFECSFLSPYVKKKKKKIDLFVYFKSSFLSPCVKDFSMLCFVYW